MEKTFSQHTSSIVESQTIGPNTTIWAFVHVLPDAVIGQNVNICDHCFVENQVKIGDNVTIKCHVSLWDGVELENNVFVGPSVVFSNDRHPRSKNQNFKQEGILVKEGASLGAGSVILPGITIGRFSMVGAGSVVTKNVNDHELVYGNPARVQGYVCTCGQRLAFKEENNASCECGKSWAKSANGLTQR